eukprot:349897-Chlamydomonas_euryale.AAC.1
MGRHGRRVYMDIWAHMGRHGGAAHVRKRAHMGRHGGAAHAHPCAVVAIVAAGSAAAIGWWLLVLAVVAVVWGAILPTSHATRNEMMSGENLDDAARAVNAKWRKEGSNVCPKSAPQGGMDGMMPEAQLRKEDRAPRRGCGRGDAGASCSASPRALGREARACCLRKAWARAGRRQSVVGGGRRHCATEPAHK